MSFRGLAISFCVILAPACGQAGTNADISGTQTAAPSESTADAELTSGGDGVAAEIAGEWRCKAQGDIPIGLLDVTASGDYKFTVVSNSLWDPKPNDSGNGKGKIGAPEGMLKPLNGPLVDTYEILDIARAESEWGVRIYLNNDFGSLMHCGLASKEG